eukprot:c10684_g1_i2.p1 GENE.c10684_g1_i2~~c10684_g1_i2.p1  ORF type:complete len:145 (-),score=28.20 c10684_g1_i2:46-480(-)
MATLTWWDKVCCMFGMVYDLLFFDEKKIEEELKRVMNNLEKELSEMFPRLRNPLIVVCSLRSLKAKRIVGVVGAGHVEGIVRHWDTEIDVQALVTVPKKRRRIVTIPRLLIGGLALYFLSRVFNRNAHRIVPYLPFVPPLPNLK